MQYRVIIVHPSEIVLQGLSSMIRQEYDHDCVLLSSVGNLSDYSTIKESRIILLIDSKIDQNDFALESKELNANNKVNVILIRDSGQEKDCKDNCDCCFFLDDSKARIHDILNPLILNKTQQNSSKSASWLTEREVDVIKLVALGKTNKEMADELCISIHTVISHRKNITEKLGIKSISGLTVYAILNKLIDTESIDIESLI